MILYRSNRTLGKARAVTSFLLSMVPFDLNDLKDQSNNTND